MGQRHRGYKAMVSPMFVSSEGQCQRDRLVGNMGLGNKSAGLRDGSLDSQTRRPQKPLSLRGGTGTSTPSTYNRDWVVLNLWTPIWRIADPMPAKGGVNHEAGSGIGYVARQ